MRGLPVTGRSAVELGVVNRTPAVLYEDFINFGQTQLSTTATVGQWFIGGANAVTTCVDQIDITPASGTDVIGAVSITTTGASGDEAFIQLEGASFLCCLGRKMVFSTRIRLDTITTANQTFGMFVPSAVTATEDPEDNTGGAIYGVGFSIVAGVVNYIVRDATAAVSAAAGLTLTASTTTGWHTFEIYWDGVNTIEFWIDRTRYISYSGTSIPIDLYLSPAIGLSTGSAATKAMSVDWIYAAVEAPPNGR